MAVILWTSLLVEETHLGEVKKQGIPAQMGLHYRFGFSFGSPEIILEFLTLFEFFRVE